MHAWEAIQKSTDYIEEHLKEELSTEALSDAVGLSPFYYQRLFKRLVNKPVQEYIKQRRLARAAAALDEESRILDVALEYGFSSHANFTRAFKDVFAITPEAYKREKPRLNTFLKPELSMQYTMVDEGVPLIAGDIVLEIQRRRLKSAETYLGLEAQVGIAGQIPAGESTGADVPGLLWERYHAAKDRIAPALVPGIELGMSGMANLEEGTFSYFAGGLAKDAKVPVPEGFCQRQLSAGSYLVCVVESETFEQLVTEALDQAMKYLYGTWLPHHGLTTQPFSAEKYNTGKAGIPYMEIWTIPV